MGAWVGITICVTGARAAPNLQMAQIQQSSPTSASFRVDIPDPQLEEVLGTGDVILSVPGYGPFAAVGAPDLPYRSFLIGIPDGVEPTLQVRVLGSRLLPGARPRPVPLARIEEEEGGLPSQTTEFVRDPSVYSSEFPQVWARLGDRGRLRHISVVRVEVFPFRWDPGMPGIEMATSMEIEVTWPANASRPAGRQAVIRDDDGWEQTYSRAILNWDAARSFRTSPTGWESSGLRREMGSGPQMRIDVDTTAIYGVTYEDLQAAGWDVGPVPIEQLAMEERRFDENDPDDPFVAVDVPIHIADYDENGSFNEGDAVFFFGMSSWDSFDPVPRIKRYGRRNAYWLFARPEGGARMEQGTSTLGRTDLTSETQFLWTEYLEGDGAYMDLISSFEASSPLQDGILNVETEHFYWLGPEPEPETYLVTIELPGVIQGRRLRGAYQGIMDGALIPAISIPQLAFGPVGGALVDLPTVQVQSRSRQNFDFPVETVGSIPLADRTQMRLLMAVDAYGCALDYVEWTYDRSYSTFEDRIAFQTDLLTGPRQFDLSGFGSFDILLFEVTDSLAPRFLTFTEDQTFREEGERVLRMQLDLGDAPSRRVFTAVEANAAFSPIAIERASDRDLAAPGEAELIVITHADFRDGVQPLVTQRESQGWEVEVATTREVFDQFDGGRATPTAIRNYLRYLFRSRSVDPTHLLLVGDGSNDFPEVLPRSGPNFVPTQTLPSDAYSVVSELVACDVWYVDNLAGTGERLDFLYDMHVGRLPVGNQTELNNMVSKIVGYANFRDADQWRNRGVTMADDEFSSRISYDGDYMYRPNEGIFRRGGEIGNRIIRDSGFTDFQPDSFYLECYLDTVACLERCIPVNPEEPDCADRICPLASDGCGTSHVNTETLDLLFTQDYVEFELQLPRKFQNMVSRGYLYVVFQSHGNRSLAAHEEIWQEQPGGRSDSAQLQNVEKPFLFFGFGCHFAQFSNSDEASFGRGDCLSEKMLFLDQGRGAVAAIASTGFEWLNANDLFQIAMMRSWFVDPTLDEDGHARWLLGDLVDGAKLELLQTSSSYGPPQSLTYVNLGDPSMLVDLAPPRVDRVEVNGTPWVVGEPLVAESESDSARIEVWLRDEVWIQTVSVFDAGVEVDSSRFAVDPDPNYAADGRHAILRYQAELDVPTTDYQIEVRGRDRAGRAQSVFFPVRLSTTFELQRTEGWVELRAGDIISVGDSVRVTVQTPISREPSDLNLLLDGKPLPAERVPLGGSEHVWRLETVIPFVKENENQALEVSVARREGSDALRSILLVGSVGSADIELTDVFNFPNPFTDDTRVLYHLNGAARSARLQVFTLRGQKIYEVDGTARPGENSILWDGRDMDGDEVGNGVYFYKLEVGTEEGRKLSRIERIARVR